MQTKDRHDRYPLISTANLNQISYKKGEFSNENKKAFKKTGVKQKNHCQP
jgi:hypothetical protein